MIITQAHTADRPAILTLHRRAFGDKEGPQIVTLVDAMFNDPTAQPLTSLIAERDGRLLGHVLLSPVTLSPNEAGLSAQILSPVSVEPAEQKSGVGTRLIEHGLDALRDAGTDLCFVYGDPAYYTRFGFAPARTYGLSAPHPIPEAYKDAWMVQALQDGALDTARPCVVRCCDALNDPRYW